MLNSLLLLLSLFATERGPWLLIGRVPDRNPYVCTETVSGTYVGPSASITDSRCFVWTLGSGTTPNILILRNGSQATPTAKGSVIEYYNHVVYVKGTDGVTWYSWDDSIDDFQTFGTNDPSMAGPTGLFVSTSGSDSNSCMAATSTSTPKRHIAGVSGAAACLTPGVTLWVRGSPTVTGIYDEGLSAMPSGTNWTTGLVRIANYPGETVWMAPTTPGVGNPNSVLRFEAGAEHYIEFDGINMDGRTAGVNNTVTFFATASGEPHHIRIKNATLYGMTTDNSAYSDNASHVIELPTTLASSTGGFELINLTISGGGRPDTVQSPGFEYRDNGYGIYVAAPNVIVDHCDISGTKGAGIHVYNDDGQVPNNSVIKNNIVHDISRNRSIGQLWGIITFNGTGHKIYNNVVYNIIAAGGTPSDGQGIVVASGASTAVVYNNTITQNMAYGLHFGVATGNAAVNNISYNNGTNYAVVSGTASPHTNSIDTNGDPTNPNFTSPGTGDFSLGAGPAVDTGTPTGTSSVFTTDRDSIARPQGAQWDIGAYEKH